MCALLEDRVGERRIYESVRRIYDIQSSSEDSLDHRKRHGRDRKASSIGGNSRATRTASLFIDRLKSDFQRDDDFVPRFRTHCQRNWCPKFTTKYIYEPEEGERPTSLCRSVSKSLVSVTPKVYSIGLYEPRKKAKRKTDLDNEVDRELRVVEYFKRCTLLARRSLSRNEICSKKWMPDLLSASTVSIPLISIPTEFHLPVLNEKDSVVHSSATVTHESVFYSPSLRSLLLDDGKSDRSQCEERKKVLDATLGSRRFTSNVETSRDRSPPKGLADDLFLEDVSSNESCISNCCREFFSPIETTREARSASEEYYSENGILEDIRKRIDKDFERSSSKVEEDFEDFSYSDDSSFFDKACSFDRDHDYETFLDPKDDFLTSIEQSKSVPIIPSSGRQRRSSKSVTSLSSTLFQDDLSDLSSPRISVSKDTFDESYDSNGPSRSSINSIVYDDYAISHDFPFARRDISPERDKTLPVRSLLDYTNLASVASLASVFSISNGLTSKKFEGPTASKNITVTPCALTLSKRKLRKTFSRGGSSFRREKLSEHRLVESIDSGVLTDYSRNDLRACGSTAERNANVFYIHERQEPHGEAPYVASDSVCSDDSLDRRVDRAVKKCTEDLVLLERRVKLKLKTVGGRLDTSKRNFSTLFDWSSGDECIGSISTPSLVSLTDSETT
ncbi:hypothetical protein V1478_006682 [Vespula squamosa]|uniref:Uncharacterized protein n=1 Tax=Vespula squamosa TaxID=30214 RepID=A0ABD2B8I9_VESSQ